MGTCRQVLTVNRSDSGFLVVVYLALPRPETLNFRDTTLHLVTNQAARNLVSPLCAPEYGHDYGKNQGKNP
jgi:hypothetical protein